MSSSNIAPAKKQTFSVAISTESYQNLIRNTLKDPKRANRFIASITSAVATTPALQTCEPSSILAGGLLGEALNLSPSPQLGQYYLVPFKQKAKYDREGHLLSPECSKAQFVLGYKGYVQLALRSGQYSDLDCMEIRQGEYLGKDPHTAKPQFKFIEDDDLRESLPIVGYMAYFEYLNGFRKCIYWSREKMLNHADTYSQAFSKDAYPEATVPFYTYDWAASNRSNRYFYDLYGVYSNADGAAPTETESGAIQRFDFHQKRLAARSLHDRYGTRKG